MNEIGPIRKNVYFRDEHAYLFDDKRERNWIGRLSIIEPEVQYLNGRGFSAKVIYLYERPVTKTSLKMIFDFA